MNVARGRADPVEAEYTSARHAMAPSGNTRRSAELRRMVDFEGERFPAPPRAPQAEQKAGGPERRLVG
jgi:hypothetical protein